MYIEDVLVRAGKGNKFLDVRPIIMTERSADLYKLLNEQRIEDFYSCRAQFVTQLSTLAANVAPAIMIRNLYRMAMKFGEYKLLAFHHIGICFSERCRRIAVILRDTARLIEGTDAIVPATRTIMLMLGFQIGRLTLQGHLINDNYAAKMAIEAEVHNDLWNLRSIGTSVDEENMRGTLSAIWHFLHFHMTDCTCHLCKPHFWS